MYLVVHPIWIVEVRSGGHQSPSPSVSLLTFTCSQEEAFILTHALVVVVVVQEKLALNVTTENGKTLADARGDVFRGLGKECRVKSRE